MQISRLFLRLVSTTWKFLVRCDYVRRRFCRLREVEPHCAKKTKKIMLRRQMNVFML